MGGSEKACVRMANALSVVNDVTVITIWGNAGIEKELAPNVHLIHKFPSYIRGVANISGRVKPEYIYRFYVKDKYDIEIAVGDGLESHIISGSPNPNKFSWVHINLGNSGTKKSKKSLRKYGRFKRIICVSDACRTSFEKEMGKRFPVTVCYTPLDSKKIQLLSQEPGKVPENTIVAIGRLEQVKGYDRLIKAVSMLPDLNYKVYIYGDGTKKEELGRLISELGLENKVSLRGQVNNPYPFIKSAKALICTSYEESFGFVAIEAMLLRTPVISTKCGGMEEILSEPSYGYLCENSIEGIVDGLRHVSTDQTKIDVEMAYKRALDYSVPICAKQFEDAIK